MRLQQLPRADQGAIRKALASAFVEYHYLGLGGLPAKCGVCYDFDDTADGHVAACVMTELPDNPGTSVTNFAEQLATELFDTLRARMGKKLHPDNIRFYEYYPASRVRERPTVDQITFTVIHRSQHTVFIAPQWRRVDLAPAPQLVR